MDQMLRGLIAKRRGEAGAKDGKGKGQGQANGGSGGGTGGDGGYSVPGMNPFEAPAYGPPRMRFDKEGGGRGEDGKGGLENDLSDVEANSENLSVDTLEDDGKGDIDLRRIPERYRDAVKEFFSESELEAETPWKQNDSFTFPCS